MLNGINRNIDIAGNTEHSLACDFGVTLREINKYAGDAIYSIVCDLDSKINKDE